MKKNMHRKAACRGAIAAAALMAICSSGAGAFAHESLSQTDKARAAQASARGEKASAVLARAISSSDFAGTGVGVLALRGSDTLLCHDCERLLIPASNMKLVSTALALHSLGPDYRYETRLAYSGDISDGELTGDLYIIGGGDPTTGSGNRIAMPTDSLFGKWRRMIADAGIRKINGRIIGYGHFFEGEEEHPSWEYADVGTYYGTGTSGLTFYENTIDFRVSAGEKPGSALNIRQVYPQMPWMEFRYGCSTGKAGSGNTLYFYPDHFTPVGELRGTFAIDRNPKTESAANKFPEYTLAWYFCQYLKNHGIACSKGPSSEKWGGSSGQGAAKPEMEDLTIIGGTLSPTLAEIASVTGRHSNNLYAETLFRTLGKEYCGSGCYDSSAVAVRGLLEEIGVQGHRYAVRDGSGLSHKNLVTAGFLCDLLTQMMESPSYGAFLESFPYPGGEGTIKNSMKSVPESIRERIRMKSGSMGGVRCFSGYIMQENGSPVVFSILVNSYTVPLSRIQAWIEKIILALAQ